MTANSAHPGRRAAVRVAMMLVSSWLPSPEAPAAVQVGLFCPSTLGVIVGYEGRVYTGEARRTEGWGYEATHPYWATDASGRTISGRFGADILDCAEAYFTGDYN